MFSRCDYYSTGVLIGLQIASSLTLTDGWGDMFPDKDQGITAILQIMASGT